MKHKLLVLLGTIVALAATACAAVQPTETPAAGDDGSDVTPAPTDDTPSADGDQSLAGTAWTLQTIGGEPLVAGSNITLSFDAETMGGYTGCNNYGGPYTAGQAGSLSIAEIAQTEAACSEPEGVMPQEAAYTEQLRGATAYQIDGDTLTIQGASAELIYTRQQRTDANPAALIGTAWRLAAFNGEPTSETFTIAFPADGQMLGRPACRVVAGGYVAEGDSLHFTWQSMVGEACDELSIQEANFTDALTWASYYRLGDGQFEIETERGETLTFEAEDAAPPLEGTSWELLAFVGPEPMPAAVTDKVPGSSVTLAFDDGSAGGSGGCNSYGGSYEQNGSELTFAEMVSTMMACADQGVTDQEARYLGELESVTHFVAVGDVLWLGTAEGGALIFQVAE